MQALSELSRELDPKDTAGNVICLHVANPSAFRDYVRFFVPEDGKNLNRVFPGKKDGTLSERIAWTITEKLQSKADYYIDLHAGDTSEEVMPFVYYNVAAGEKIARVSANMAMAADMEVRASSTATTGAYSSACQRGLPAILMERGGGGKFTDSEVQAYKRDVKNIMIRMGLLSGEEVHTVQQKNVTRAEYLEAETPQRTVRRDVSANHLAGRAGGGDPGGASLRGDPAAASCQALPPSSAEAYRQESVKGYGGFTITPPDGRCIKKVEAIKLDLIQ